MGLSVRMGMLECLHRRIYMGSSLVAKPYTIKNVIKFHYHKHFTRMHLYLITLKAPNYLSLVNGSWLIPRTLSPRDRVCAGSWCTKLWP